MGKLNTLIKLFYDESGVESNGDTALLGFTDNKWYKGELYDVQLKNWNINSSWIFPKKYDTIICTRTAFFSKDPEGFIKQCYENLNSSGVVFIDWGLGNHFYTSGLPITVGSLDNKDQYGNYNGTISTLSSIFWDKDFEEHLEVQLFKKRLERFGYTGSLTEHVNNEVKQILSSETLAKYFDFTVYFKTLWEDTPQLYILIKGIKKCYRL